MARTPERYLHDDPAQAHRTWWLAASGLVLVGGLVGGIVVLGWLPAIGSYVCMALLGGCFGWAWAFDGRRVRTYLTGGAAGGLGLAASFVVLPALIGAWTVPVVVALALTSPWSTSWATRLLHRGTPTAEDLAALSRRDLAHLWSSTYDDLHRSGRSVPKTLLLVQQRARILDELDRRDPVDFHLWLDQVGAMPAQRESLKR